MNTNVTRSQCIDAETLAAWADGGLPAHEAAQVELHLSNCERCQEVLAALVRIEPAAAVVVPFWTRRPVRWSAAVLAAAAAVVLMVWTQRPASFLKQESTVASNETGASISSDFRSVVPPPSRPESDQAGQFDDLRKAATPATEAPAAAAQERMAPKVQAAPSAARQTVVPPAPVAAAAPPPPPAAVRATPPPPPPTEPPALPGGVVGGVVGGVAGGRAVAAQPTGELRELVLADKVSEEVPVVEILAPVSTALAARRLDAAQAGAARSNAGGGRGGGSPVPVRWRILKGTRVERSLDDGVTWSPAELTTASTQLADRQIPVLQQRAFFLTGGAAASQTVCWLVGRDGVVFLAKDGVTFQQVSSPDPAAIKSVEAVDDLHATITTVDGRKFSTSDAGQTWHSDPLQGFRLSSF